VRVGLAGPGFIGRLVLQHVLRNVPGLDVVAVAGRSHASAQAALRHAGADDGVECADAAAIAAAIAAGRRAVCADAVELARADGVDVVVESTGNTEAGAAAALAAIEGGKHVVLVNAELDALLGPLLARRAQAAGVVVTGIDGDEPGVAMGLIRYVRAIGLEPVMAGNLKGFFDPYRTPETQAEFAARVGLRPEMATSFADGTKLSIECAVLCNATGFGVERRGMSGYRCERIEDILDLVPTTRLEEGGLVDFALGAAPGSGAFVLGRGGPGIDADAFRYCKMGDGPLYLFYQPFHIPHVGAPLSIARAALFDDATVRADAGLVCDVVAVAKRDLRAGETLDGIGGFTCYGQVENVSTALAGRMLPVGLAAGCRLERDVARDEPVLETDIERPAERLVDRLHDEQRSMFVAA
jgi:predicted homoserine dehydrogenase-like protein